ncbi:bifunctional DNA primase/polymerase [Planktotalea sp.]|uniref:bifunctional DNA primase/polymerase n=1 Tax=Planktotalea sp. TaxID=2029877 RepID=UPI003F6AE347
MKAQSPIETTIDKAKAMIEGGWRIVPLRPKQKRPVHLVWQEREFTLGDFRPDSGIGIVTGHGIVALDVDAYCEDVSAAIAAEAIKRFGDTLERVGEAPKTALFYRGLDIKKSNIILKPTGKAPNGKQEQLEVLGNGQQIVAFGVHPDTGQLYTWKGVSPWDTFLGEVDDLLPEIKQEGLDDFVDWVTTEYGEPRKLSQQAMPTIPAPVAGGWGRSALSKEVAELVRTPEGNRNNALNTSAFRMGQIVGGGHLDENKAVAALKQAALQMGLEACEILPTIKSGLTAGKSEPRHPEKRATEAHLDAKTAKDADRIAKRIKDGLKDVLAEVGIKVDAIAVDAERVGKMIGRSFWSASQSKLHFLNREGHLVKFTQGEGWKFMLATFGSPVGADEIAAWLSQVIPKDRQAAEKSLMAAIRTPVMDHILLYRQRDMIAWGVDMFATHEVFVLREHDAQIVLPHITWTTGPIDMLFVDDFRTHWPDVDAVLKFIIDSRFAGDRKKAYLWWQADSDFGKGLFTGLLKDLGVVVETSTKEIEKVMEGQPVGLSADNFKRAIVLLVDEFKSVKSELKQLQNEIELSPKNQLRQRAAIYTKLFMSAENVASLVTSHGVEDQFANRMSLIQNSGRIDDRQLFSANKSSYAASLRNWIGLTLNQHVEEYRKLGSSEAVTVADAAVTDFHANRGIGKQLGRVSESLHEIADAFRTAMLDHNHDFCPDIVKLTNGGVGLLRPRKLFEDWLADNYDQSERMTFVKKAKNVLALASRDGEVKVRLTSDRKSVKCLLLKE